MEISSFQSLEINCPSCNNLETIKYWTVIDLKERPDLVEKIRTDELDKFNCNNCSESIRFKKAILPLLIINRDGTPPLIFCSPSNYNKEQQEAIMYRMVAEIDLKYIQHGINDRVEANFCEVIPRDELGRFMSLILGINRPETMISVRKFLFKFLTVDSWEEAEITLRQNQEILSTENLKILERGLEELGFLSFGEEENWIQKLMEFLFHCSNIGISKAINEKRGTPFKFEASYNQLAMLTRIVKETHTTRDWERRIQLCKIGLNLLEKSKYPEMWAWFNSFLASGYSRTSKGDQKTNIERSIYHHERALEYYENSNDPEEWALEINNLAQAYRKRIEGSRKDNLEKAISLHLDALDVRKRERNPKRLADTQNDLGNAFLFRIKGDEADNIERAISHYKNALSIRESERLLWDWAITHNNLANAYMSRKYGKKVDNLQTAIHHLESASQIHTRENDPEWWANVQRSLGNIYSKLILEEISETSIKYAVDYYQESIEVQTKEKYPREWAMTHHNIAVAYLNEIPDALIFQRNLEKAIFHINEALEINTKSKYPYRWAREQILLGKVYSQRIAEGAMRNIEKAIEHFNNALEVITPLEFPKDNFEIHEACGEVLFKQSYLDNAIQSFDWAIEAHKLINTGLFTFKERILNINSISEIYTKKAYCLVKKGLIKEAVMTLEKGKTRVLFENLLASKIESLPITPVQKESLIKLRVEVSELERELNNAIENSWPNQIDISNTLKSKRLEFNTLLENLKKHFQLSEIANFEDLTEAIPHNGVIVIPIVTSKGSLVVIIHQNLNSRLTKLSFELHNFSSAAFNNLNFKIGDQNSIFKKPIVKRDFSLWGNIGLQEWLELYSQNPKDIKDWFRGIDDNCETLWRNFVSEIYELLEEELNLKKGSSVTFIPQSFLSILPLEAAYRTENAIKKYFYEDYLISYSPSLNALIASAQNLRNWQKRNVDSILMVSNPNDDLVFSSVESKSILRYFHKENTLFYEKEDAKKKSIKEEIGNKSFLHFSCHSLHSWEDFENSGIRLANGEILNFFDLIAFPKSKSFPLVVLSACETALTDINNSPNEHLGIPLAFLQVGASGIINTLWEVDDLSTFLFMEEFYAKLFSGSNPMSALFSARNYLRNLMAREVIEKLETALSEKGINHFNRPLIEKYLKRIKRLGSDTKLFGHPYFWAPFYYTGAQTFG